MKKVHVTTDYHEKQLQRALLQYNRPQNAPLVREALIKAGREDLIGYGPECLVRPEKAAPQIDRRRPQNKKTPAPRAASSKSHPKQGVKAGAKPTKKENYHGKRTRKS
jgi:hypothetical protein